MSYTVFGSSRLKSTTGSQGPRGIPGVKGDKGDKGDKGEKGIKFKCTKISTGGGIP